MHMREQIEFFAAAIEQEMSSRGLILQGILDSCNNTNIYYAVSFHFRVKSLWSPQATPGLNTLNTAHSTGYLMLSIFLFYLPYCPK